MVERDYIFDISTKDNTKILSIKIKNGTIIIQNLKLNFKGKLEIFK
jgi:hypothetical protein